MDVNTLLNQAKVEIIPDYIRKVIAEFVNMAKGMDNPNKVSTARDLFKNYLNTDINSIGTSLEMNKVHYLNNEIINYTMKKGTYVPDSNGHSHIDNNQRGWSTYQSWHLENNKKYEHGDISHRFYINTSPRVLPDFIKALLSEYEGKNIPYYFKVNMDAQLGRRDSIVIYSSTDELQNTLLILNSIERKYPQLISACNEPHMFTSNIGGWYGYAQENKQFEGRESYTGLVSRIFTDVFKKSVIDWVNKHPDYLIDNNGKRISVLEYLDENLLKGTNMNWQEARKSKIEYIKRVTHLLWGIPQIDNTFIKEMCNNLKSMFKQYHFNPDNICLNEDVMKQLYSKKVENDKVTPKKKDEQTKAVTTSNGGNNDDSEYKELLSQIRQEYMREQLYNQMNDVPVEKKKKELDEARQLFIEQMEGNSGYDIEDNEHTQSHSSGIRR